VRHGREAKASVADEADAAVEAFEAPVGMARRIARGCRRGGSGSSWRAWTDQIPDDLTDAFRKYLGDFGDKREPVLALLHPLAHARGDGLMVEPPDGTSWAA
jgi:hypothetical protein